MPDFSHVLDELTFRGLVAEIADGAHGAKLRAMLDPPNQVKLYCGFDPTAPSLTIGNLVAISLLRIFQKHGHQPFVLMGGATGLIGDPSGKDTERVLLSRADVDANIERQHPIFSRFIDFSADTPNGAILVNNHEWTASLTVLDFLRDIGKHFRVDQMVASDSARNRMEREGGLSFTEFSYSLLQALDYLHLHTHHGVTLQVGGSDQLGNILFGRELIYKKLGAARTADACGLVAPLLTKADGSKIGKSESGAIWLEENRTSAFEFYQYLTNLGDPESDTMLRMMTDIAPADFAIVQAAHLANPGARPLQHRLAADLTALVHSRAKSDDCRDASQFLFYGTAGEFTDAAIATIGRVLPLRAIKPDLLPPTPARLSHGLKAAGLVDSTGAFKNLLAGGGLMLNGVHLDKDPLLADVRKVDGVFIVRKGKTYSAVQHTS